MSGGLSPLPGAETPAWHSYSSATPRWYAAYTCVHHEKRILQQLTERDIDGFVPLYRSVRRWKDRRKELDLVLFPGYVFVRISLQKRLRVLQVPGVVNFVNFNGLPTPLPEGEVEALRRASAQGVFAEPHPYLKTGRRVRIRNGPFTGIEGVLLRKKDRYRFVLSIEMIMRSVAIEMDAADVEALL